MRVFQFTGSLMWSNMSSAVFLPFLFFLVDGTGHEKKLLLSLQLSRAKDDFSDPTFHKELRGSESGSHTGG